MDLGSNKMHKIKETAYYNGISILLHQVWSAQEHYIYPRPYAHIFIPSSNLLIQNYIFGTKDIVVLVGMDL